MELVELEFIEDGSIVSWIRQWEKLIYDKMGVPMGRMEDHKTEDLNTPYLNYNQFELEVMDDMIKEGYDPQNKHDVEAFWTKRLK